MRKTSAIKKDPLIVGMSIYLLIMLLGIAVRTYITQSVATTWLINFAGFVLFWIIVFRDKIYTYQNAIILILVYFICSFITLFLNLRFYSFALDKIGTNINTLVFGGYFIIFAFLKRSRPLKDEGLESFFFLLSFLGTASILIAWVSGFRNIIQGLTGRINVYDVRACGLFYSKNIYGAFVSLSAHPDLYLYQKYKRPRSLLLFALKAVAVALSFSRAALLQLVLFTFFYFYFNQKGIRKLVYLVVIVLLCVIIWRIAIKLFPGACDIIINRIIRFQAGDAGRAWLRRQAASTFFKNSLSIFFGVGFMGLYELNLDIDNTYSYLLFTGGIIKCCFFAFLFFESFRTCEKRRHVNNTLIALCQSVGISYMVFAFFESIPLAELGLTDFLYTLFMLFIPLGYREPQRTPKYLAKGQTEQEEINENL